MFTSPLLNRMVSKVFVSSQTSYANVAVPKSAQPQLNLTGIFPGPLSSEQYTSFVAHNTSAVGAGGGEVHIRSGLDSKL
jgi:hypothetical protein